jgi:hypothetical protein
LTNLPAGATPALQAVTTAGATTTDTITAGAFVGDGSALTGVTTVPQTLEQVTTAGSTTTTSDISFTGTGTLTIDQDTISGSLLKINGGTGNGMVRIGEDSAVYDRSNGDRSVLIGRNVGAFGVAADVVALGSGAANNLAGQFATCLGDDAGQNRAGIASTAVGRMAGEFNLGANSVAIGQYANQNTAQAAALGNNITINATGVELNNTNASSCVIKPVRQTPDVTTETNAVYYDDVSGELRYGGVQAGTVGSLSQVLQVGNTGGTIDVNEVQTVSAFVENSLNFVFPTAPATTMTTSAIPYNSFDSTFVSVLNGTDNLKFAGAIETWISNETISAGDVVGLDITQGDLNRVQRFQPFTAETNNCMVVGIATNNSVAGGACFVCTHGITTVKAGAGTFNRGAVLLCAADGGVSPGPLGANSMAIGFAMATSTVTVAGTGILCYIKSVLHR